MIGKIGKKKKGIALCRSGTDKKLQRQIDEEKQENRISLTPKKSLVLMKKGSSGCVGPMKV